MTRRPTGPKPSRRPSPASASAKSATATAAPHPNSSDDLAALAAFCAECPDPDPTNDLAFATWESCHDDLDLRIPLWLTAEDAAAGGVHRVVYSCSTTLVVRGAPPERAKHDREVAVPPGAKDGQQLVLKGFGDRAPDRVGDLIVTFQIKAQKKT